MIPGRFQGLRGFLRTRQQRLPWTFAERILGKDEAKRISKEISEFAKKQEKGV